MSRFADLHLHSRHSDGTFTPAEVVERARSLEFSCLALTDHDAVSGVAQAAELCQQAGIEFIPGIELTAHLKEKEVHVLGYYVRHESPEFLARIDQFKQVRAERVVQIVKKLQELGVGLELADVLAVAAPGCALGRLHVARALMNRGLITEIDDAFYRFLGKGKPAFVPKYRLEVAEAARLIHQFGGVAIFAHPGLAKLDKQFEQLLAAGLDGVEVWHSRHTPAQTERYLQYARNHGCLATGGSDCHGLAKDHILMGSVQLDYGYVEKLKEFHARSLSKSS